MLLLLKKKFFFYLSGNKQDSCFARVPNFVERESWTNVVAL